MLVEKRVKYWKITQTTAQLLFFSDWLIAAFCNLMTAKMCLTFAPCLGLFCDNDRLTACYPLYRHSSEHKTFKLGGKCEILKHIILSIDGSFSTVKLMLAFLLCCLLALLYFC